MLTNRILLLFLIVIGARDTVFSQIVLIESTSNYYTHQPIRQTSSYRGNNNRLDTESNSNTQRVHTRQSQSIYSIPDSVKWMTNYDEASTKARIENKPLVMYFMGSDWCSPCKLLKKDFFDTKKFKSLAQNVILLKVDIPRRVDVISSKQLQKNKELLQQYNSTKGFPALVAVSPAGYVIAKHSSYSMSLRDPKPYFQFMESLR